jgi:dihydroneopterin aldolase
VEPRSELGSESPRQHPISELRLRLSGIHLTGRHGVRPEEREHGNRFVVDVDLECASVVAVETDELEDTIDYQGIGDVVRGINDRQTFNLIESFAGAIASALLAEYSAISSVTVQVSKLTPPGLPDVDRTVAEVTRRRR